MVNQLLVSLVNSVLGTGKPTARGNFAYHCPNCNHHKLKLEICLDETSMNYQKYGCWVCGFKGKKLSTLFKKVNTPPEKLHELKQYSKNSSIQDNTVVETKVELPSEFKSLTQVTDITSKRALSYLKRRGITEDDILKYNIGYCETGKYSNMIIIPSYDENGVLNYFMGRSFEPESSKKANPPVSRNIIPFELFINWNSPITLCEGMFDAITIKRNVIPLLGKNLQSKLMKKLVTSSVQKIYIALDKDAIKKALDFCEQLLNEGKEVYLVELSDKDPNEIGFKNFTHLIQNTFPLTYSGLMEKKLQL